MPPKAKYTWEQILDVAYEMVRRHGMEMLSARGLAAELGTSTAPIFTAFRSIEEVQQLVIERAQRLSARYLEEGMRQISPPFKGVGLKYIQFAKDEPELFRLLYMQGDEGAEATHFLPAAEESTPGILHLLEEKYGLSAERGRWLYNHLAVYTYGLATLFALRANVFTMEDVDRMLSEIFFALTEGENGQHH